MADKARKLTPEEYLIEEEKWLKRNNEYFDKLIALNVEEHEIIEKEFNGDFNTYEKTDSRCKEIEDKRVALKEEYKGYVDHYFDPRFYCLMTTNEDVSMLVTNSKSTKQRFIKDLKNLGKLMSDDPLRQDRIGTFKGIVCAIDDYYYLLYDEKNKKEYWYTCVGDIYPYKKPKSYTMVTNGKDYI